ncbi:MAG: helix-turn-helix transcriptional regulator [Lachnospiraceae bacterium]|nr:helix-turn-helix transcriptional regulator [Lachnospiraceae bacterium]
MQSIHFADNIARLRKEKKITQEQLADFVGVTKASVSKWETGQSLPDVVLLPQLAAYFDVTIDEMLGYEPWLSKEQIQKIYLELAKEFATEEFEKVMNKSRELVKKYYSCYEFLSQIVCLWINHYMLPGGTRSMEILEDAEAVCDHILTNSKDIGLCSDVVSLKATIGLRMGKATEVIETLEEMCNPYRLETQNVGILIGAYLQAGELEKANSFTQISMYDYLVSLVGCATQYISIHKDNLALCEETFGRIHKVADAYELEKLNFNVMVLFYYQMAIIFCQHEKKTEAIALLKKFIYLTDAFLQGEEGPLKGDSYFDALDEWFNKLTLGQNAPRDKKIIYDSMISVFATPAFAVLEAEDEYQKLKEFARKRGSNL